MGRRAAAAFLLAAAAPLLGGCGGGADRPAPAVPPLPGPARPAHDRLAVLRDGRERPLDDATAAALAADLLAALAACTDRERRLQTEADWSEALEGDAVHLALAEPRVLTVGGGPARRATDVLAPLDGSGRILVRDGGTLFSPFTGAPRELLARLEAAGR